VGCRRHFTRGQLHSSCQAVGQPWLSVLQLGVMTPLTRASWVTLAGLGFVADLAVAQPKPDPSATAGQGATSSPATATTTAAEAPMPAGSSSTGATTTGGYSWNEKKPARRSVPVFRVDPARPLVEAPSFEMLPDGRSRVTLPVSDKTNVGRRTKKQGVVFVVERAQVGVANNLNPLVTTHFATPLSRARLTRQKSSVSLELELRHEVSVTHEVKANPNGSMLLIVTLPALPERQSQQTVTPTRTAAPR